MCVCWKGEGELPARCVVTPDTDCAKKKRGKKKINLGGVRSKKLTPSDNQFFMDAAQSG